MIELVTHIIDKLDIKRLLISTFIGVLLRLFLPSSFIFNTIIENKISLTNQEIFGFLFYILFVYVSTLLISFLKNHISNVFYFWRKVERSIGDEIENINFINSLIPEDKIVLLNLIRTNNSKTKAYLGSDFISNLIDNRYAKIIPNSQTDAYSKFSSFDTQVEIILDQNFYIMLKALYDDKKILQY